VTLPRAAVRTAADRDSQCVTNIATLA